MLALLVGGGGGVGNMERYMFIEWGKGVIA